MCESFVSFDYFGCYEVFFEVVEVVVFLICEELDCLFKVILQEMIVQFEVKIFMVLVFMGGRDEFVEDVVVMCVGIFIVVMDNDVGFVIIEKVGNGDFFFEKFQCQLGGCFCSVFCLLINVDEGCILIVLFDLNCGELFKIEGDKLGLMECVN